MDARTNAARAMAALAVLAACAPVAACDRREAPPSAQPATALDPDQAAGEAAYLAPPSILQASPDAEGGLDVRGRAPPRSQVQLASPDGAQIATTADAKGVWRVRLPPADQPRLFAVSARAGGADLHAEGALLLAPGALSPAVLLRAGAAALPLTPSDGDLDMTSADYDPAGSLAAAGHAPPDAEVALMVDGVAAATGHADGQGRYALLAAGRRLMMGAHRLTVSAGGRTDTRQATLTPAASLTAPFTAVRAAEGWRVEWAPTGGGIQTTLVFAR